MSRWATLLVAALYLLPQAALALHAEEILENCASCEGEIQGLSFECSDEDCADDGHHHHRHDHDHHPGNCRVCNAGSDLAFSTPDDFTAVFVGSTFAPVPSGNVDAKPALCHAVRAPPAR